MKVALLGSGSFGVPTFEAVARAHRVVGVVTQPDKPAGRGGTLTPTPVGEFAASRLPGVPVLKPADVNDPGVVAAVRGWGPEALVVIAFGQKLGAALTDGVFAVNLHGSVLPRWRGASPVNAAVLAGDAESGNSVITLASRMDAGLILASSRVAISPRMTAGDLHDALSADGPGLVLGVLERFASGTLEPAEQDPAKVTRAGKLKKSDGWVDFAAGAEACRRRIHGLNPWPGVTVRLGAETIKLLRVEALALDSHERPGTVVDAGAGIVACGGGTALRLVEVQPAGKRAMGWADVARGRRIGAGAVLIGGPEGGSAC